MIVTDPEVQALIRLFDAEKAARQPGHGAWEHSPFAWLNSWPPSKTKGAIFESVVHRWCEGLGYRVGPTGDSEADRVIGGKRFEIKGSTLWGASYKFQQLRDQNYDAVICLGVSPLDAHCWIVPKSIVLMKWAAGEIGPQHGGRSGRDTAWLWVDPEEPQEWLSEWGGSLSVAKRALREFLSASGG